jgi:hypothetical protein
MRRQTSIGPPIQKPGDPSAIAIRKALSVRAGVSSSAPLATAVVLRNVLRVIIEVASLRNVDNKQGYPSRAINAMAGIWLFLSSRFLLNYFYCIIYGVQQAILIFISG